MLLNWIIWFTNCVQLSRLILIWTELNQFDAFVYFQLILLNILLSLKRKVICSEKFESHTVFWVKLNVQQYFFGFIECNILLKVISFAKYFGWSERITHYCFILRVLFIFTFCEECETSNWIESVKVLNFWSYKKWKKIFVNCWSSLLTTDFISVNYSLKQITK